MVLAGCGTLPAEEAGAFRTLASADRDAFTALAQRESDTVNAIALSRPLSSVERENCGIGKTGPCALVVDLGNGGKLSLSPTAPETRALIGALADYGTSMAELAEAKDVAAAQEAAGKAGGSVKGLIALVPGAPTVVGPIIDGIVWGAGQGLVQKRRQALLAAAEKADPAVQLAATRMGAISTRLRSNLERASVMKLDAAWEAWQRAPDQPTRTAAFQAMTAAAADVNAARQIRIEYSALAQGHARLVAALRGNGDIAAALGELETFVGILAAARTTIAADDAAAKAKAKETEGAPA